FHDCCLLVVVGKRRRFRVDSDDDQLVDETFRLIDSTELDLASPDRVMIKPYVHRGVARVDRRILQFHVHYGYRCRRGGRNDRQRQDERERRRKQIGFHGANLHTVTTTPPSFKYPSRSATTTGTFRMALISST